MPLIRAMIKTASTDGALRRRTADTRPTYNSSTWKSLNYTMHCISPKNKWYLP